MGELTRVRNALAPQGVTELWLARVLRPYGVRPRTIWLGEESAKGYVEEDFMELFRRYFPRSEVEEFRATCRKSQEMRNTKAESVASDGLHSGAAGGKPVASPN